MPTPTFIQAVPWWPQRTANAVALHKQTGGQIIWDEKHSAYQTWLKMMRAIGEGPAICLEDDVVLTENWRLKIEQAIERHPNDLILFFSMLDDDVELGSRWMTPDFYYSTLCAYFPAGAAAEIVQWIETHDTRTLERWQKMHDHIPGLWLSSRRQKYWLEVPSLVQHVGDLKSVAAPRRPLNRLSPSFRV